MRSKTKSTTRLKKYRQLYRIVQRVDQAVYDASESLEELDQIIIYLEDKMARMRRKGGRR